jgi:hypothetical protein
MKVFVGDETGLLKHVSVDKSTTVAKWGKQEKEKEILAMSFRDDTEQEVIHLPFAM